MSEAAAVGPSTPAASPTEGSGAPPPAAPAESPSSRSAESAAPGGESASPDAEAKGPAPIPYLAFKQERSKWQARAREIEQAKQAEIARLQQGYQTLESQHRDLTERFQNFDALQRVIRGNPELAQQIEDALGQDTPREQAQAVAALPPEAQAVIQRMGQFLQQQEQTRAAALHQQEQNELGGVHREVQGMLNNILTAKGFDQKEFLPFLESYVLNRLRVMGESAEMSDIPLIAAEWIGAVTKWHHNQLSNLANGKRADGRLPASPGSSAPVSAAATPYSLNEEATRRATDFLKQAGWRD